MQSSNSITPPTGDRPSSLRVAGGAIVNWWRAMTLDALIVGILWFIGLYLLKVPWAPFWALLGAVFQFIPGIGGMLAVAGPAIAATVSSANATGDGASDDRIFRLGMVFGLYALIVILDGLVIQPLILKRTTLVPWWASIVGPVALGLLIPPWGVLIAPPVLAVVFALRKSRRTALRPGRGRAD